MRVVSTPSGYKAVTVCRTEVLGFRSKWPCSGLPDCAVTFEFAPNGDLIDISGLDYDGADLLALSQDAQAFAFAPERAQ